MNKFLLIFLCLGVFPTIGLAQSKEDFYKGVDVSKRQTERYIEDNLRSGEWYVEICESLVWLAGKYHLGRPWCKLNGDVHTFGKDDCEFMGTNANYTKSAECLLNMAQNLESEVEEKRKSVVREYCSAEAGKSIYKEYDDIKGFYRSLGKPEIICADSREDDRRLLVQPVEEIVAGNKGVYYTCNRPKLEFSETGVITVKRDQSTCGLWFVRYYPTGVLSKDGTEYSLDDFDTNCVLKSWENIKK